MFQDRSLTPGLDPAPQEASLTPAALQRASMKRAMKLWGIRALLIILALGQLGDVLSTNSALANSPGAVEANPVMHLMMTLLGSWWWLWKAAVAGFFVAFAISVRKPSRRHLIFAGAVAKIYIVVLVNNLLQ
jgi:hypothetical protein